jgi:phenylglyoxylate dehydrogenase epsilon subunit
MGNGLVGMHTAEAYVERGLQVSVVRARPKKNPRVLPGYFDQPSAAAIQHVFEQHGVRFHVDGHAVSVTHDGAAFTVALSSGNRLRADLLLVAVGVRPRVSCAVGAALAIGQGILVDSQMRTSVENVWAAGDVAQGDDFFGAGKVVNAILPEAVEQGRIAGASMSGGRVDPAYRGAIPANVFKYFGHRAFSAGIGTAGSNGGAYGALSVEAIAAGEGSRGKLVFRDDTLVGASAIDCPLDPGIFVSLIRHGVAAAGAERASLARDPINAGRRAMWRSWRGSAQG